ncbi:hypothetical protein PL11201_80278 [Planktothrix sp. PCC 11201]|nr:hypothetical protein PL11201_80278 [Planktothrix sp. PCC 11201]
MPPLRLPIRNCSGKKQLPVQQWTTSALIQLPLLFLICDAVPAEYRELPFAYFA